MKLQIPEPCHESWKDMTPDEKGRFCSHCQKSVIDFRNKSDFEIHRIIRTEGKVCGRLREDQLNRTIKSPSSPPKRWFQWGTLAAFLGLSSNLWSQKHNYYYRENKVCLPGDSVVPSSQIDSIPKNEPFLEPSEKIDSLPVSSPNPIESLGDLTIRILNADGTVEPFVKIYVYVDSNMLVGGCISDFDGIAKFNFDVCPKEGVQLKIVDPLNGLDTLVYIANPELPMTKELTLPKPNKYLEIQGLIVVPKRNSFKQPITEPFRRVFHNPRFRSLND